VLYAADLHYRNKKENHLDKALTSGWHVLQDVHDAGEDLRLFEKELTLTDVGHQLSEWEPIDRLQHLQVLFADRPYWGRELRYFNQSPWWYLNEFELDADESGVRSELRFTNVDYFCRVWLNGTFLGEHEGYSLPFSFDISGALLPGEVNRLVVKVWSPWDHSIHEDAHSMRTFRVIRNLVKGTYEHDDTLIARDVNPVGIYGFVSVHTSSGAAMTGTPSLSYVLSDDRTGAQLSAQVTVFSPAPSTERLSVIVRDSFTGAVKASEDRQVALGEGQTGVSLEVPVADIAPWNVWDRGNPQTYEVEFRVGDDVLTKRIGFRTTELVRDESQTKLVLNGAPVYLRGTSYFPDVYMSTMTRERYIRDLTAIKGAGFNLIRVHVHVELDGFYDLCDELGLAVLQDSEYNWTHPVEAGWAERIVRIFVGTVAALGHHPSIVAWIALNEPGVLDGSDRTGGYAMSVSPGPQLYEAVTAADPSRPVIKGSFCEDDLLSGDSHNYRGSLQGPEEHYTAIDGTTEKLNTEFGFDAPGTEANLRTLGRLYERIRPLMRVLDETQHYQYRLIKYYTEHYRAQRGTPNWGYVQFMFIDLSPQSFYGVYDWWGAPKPAVAALAESNQPVLAMIEQTRESASGIWLINDSSEDHGAVRVDWRITDGASVLEEGSKEIALGSDAKVRIADLSLSREGTESIDADLVVRTASGRVLNRNRYRDMFGHPEHVAGHPNRMSHEYGVRLYSA
jgi:beta-mannosidase